MSRPISEEVAFRSESKHSYNVPNSHLVMLLCIGLLDLVKYGVLFDCVCKCVSVSLSIQQKPQSAF